MKGRSGIVYWPLSIPFPPYCWHPLWWLDMQYYLILVRITIQLFRKFAFNCIPWNHICEIHRKRCSVASVQQKSYSMHVRWACLLSYPRKYSNNKSIYFPLRTVSLYHFNLRIFIYIVYIVDCHGNVHSLVLYLLRVHKHPFHSMPFQWYIYI